MILTTNRLALLCSLLGFFSFGIADSSARNENPQKGSLQLDVPTDVSEEIQNAVVEFNAGSTRIVDGVGVPNGKYPWQVALLYLPKGYKDERGLQFCGGALVGVRFVLTAAHCVDGNTSASSLQVLEGTVDLRAGGRLLTVCSITIHKSYKKIGKVRFADIAVLRLNEDASNTPLPMLPEELNSRFESAKEVTIAGWGRMSTDGPKSQTLLEATLPIQSNKTCNDSYANQVKDNMFCAGRIEGGVDACYGDSGGPAIALIEKRMFQVGIVSWGEDCGQAKRYGVYTSVPVFRTWITETAK